MTGFVSGVVPMEGATVSADRLDAPQKGILFLVAGIAIFSAQDVVIRFLSGGFSVFEIVLVRSVVAVMVVLPLIRLEGGLETLKTRRPYMHDPLDKKTVSFSALLDRTHYRLVSDVGAAA